MQVESTKKSPSTFAGSLSANCATSGPRWLFTVGCWPSKAFIGQRPTVNGQLNNAFQQPGISRLPAALHDRVLVDEGAAAALGDAHRQPGLLRLVGLALLFSAALLGAGRLFA